MKNSKYYLPFILAVGILLILTACKTTKQVQHTDATEQVDTDTKVVFTQTVTEKADTCVSIPETTSTVEAELDALLKGDTTVQDTPDERVTTEVVKGIVKTQVVVKQKYVPVKVNKIIVTKSKGDQTVKDKAEIKQNDKEVERQFPINLNWIWLILAAAISIAAWHFGFFDKKNKTPTPPAT